MACPQAIGSAFWDWKIGDVATWAAAIGSAAAAWAAFKAARAAIEISQRDREDRERDRQQSQQDGNRRVALLFQATMSQLIAVVTVALEQVKSYKAQRLAYLFGGKERDNVNVLGRNEFARIGALHVLAAGISGSLANSLLPTLSWSRETATLVDKTLVPSDEDEDLWWLPVENMDGLIQSYAVLLTYARRAQRDISAIAGASLPVDDGLLD
ncbi:MAG: hypothetical protein WAM90_07705 [Rhodanobacter sp.]